MDDIDNSKKYKIEVCGFDLKIILESLNGEREKRLSKTSWKNRNPNGYPQFYSYDYNAKSVRQVDSVISYIKKQI